MPKNRPSGLRSSIRAVRMLRAFRFSQGLKLSRVPHLAVVFLSEVQHLLWMGKQNPVKITLTGSLFYPIDDMGEKQVFNWCRISSIHRICRDYHMLNTCWLFGEKLMVFMDCLIRDCLTLIYVNLLSTIKLENLCENVGQFIGIYW